MSELNGIKRYLYIRERGKEWRRNAVIERSSRISAARDAHKRAVESGSVICH